MLRDLFGGHAFFQEELMKKLLVSFLLVPFICLAGELAQLNIDTASTNASPESGDIDTTDLAYNGLVDSIVLDLGGYASPTVTVAVIATNGATVSSGLTLLSLTATADGRYPVVDERVDTSGSGITDYTEFSVAGSEFILKAYGANVTNDISVKASIIMVK